MSLHYDMVSVAARARESLGESAELVEQFLVGQQNRDGGFRDRGGQSDLYYSAFAVDALRAIESGHRRLDPVWEGCWEYLRRLESSNGLDFVHLCCFIRCGRTVQSRLPRAEELLRTSRWGRNLESFRSADGGYHPARQSALGSAYGSFLGMVAGEDLGLRLSNREGLLASLERLRTDDGGYANEDGGRQGGGATNATAAALLVINALKGEVAEGSLGWLKARARERGGFSASAQTPLPDLLSTATALHALGRLHGIPAEIRERALDFVDSLWTNDGGFFGHWADEHLDSEYTFYGLLALGELEVATCGGTTGGGSGRG